MREDFTRRCHAIEEAYEFMLAYAAQGLPGDAGSQSGGQLRELLSRAAVAIGELSDTFMTIVREDRLEPSDKYLAYNDVLQHDARASKTAIDLVLAQPAISSQLVDNLNASMHLRALLTDLFLLDDILKSATVRA